jgi:hypothetical protein
MGVPAATDSVVSRRPYAIGRVVPTWFTREAPLVAVFCAYWIALLRLIPYEISQDGWYALLVGREIIERGLPDTDYMTVFTLGHNWIDQPWACQVAFYGLYALGGLKLVLLLHTALVAGAFGLSMYAARRLGASTRSVLLVALPCVLATPWAWQFRAQAAAYPLFVAVLWLLAADSRSPSRRVFLVVPLLVLWGNVHGSVALGAVLVALRAFTYGAGEFRKRKRAPRWVARTAALGVTSALGLFANPYGLELASYYLKRPSSSALGNVNLEWRATTLSPATVLFYAVALTSIWVLGRSGRRLTSFEKSGLLAILVIAMFASRATVWFPLAALILIPQALDGISSLRKSKSARHASRMNVVVAGAGAALVAAILISTASRPAQWFESQWSEPGLRAVTDAAAADPDSRVFASSRYADWLLWKRPELIGRVAFDTRFGLYSDEQLERLYAYHNRSGDWKPVLNGFSIVVLETETESKIARDLLRERGTRVVFRDDDMTVLLRTGPAARAPVRF